MESKHQKKQIAEVCTMYFFVEFHVLFGHARFFNEENMAVLHGQKNQTRTLCEKCLVLSDLSIWNLPIVESN